MMLEHLISTNPWKTVNRNTPGKILPEDREAIQEFNTKHKGRPTEIRFELLPEPFVGSLKAPIWLLNLNPGFKKHEIPLEPALEDDKERNLRLEHESFWYLSPSMAKSPGGEYWQRKLGRLMNDVSAQKLRHALFVIEYFPYHSTNYAEIKVLPSQQFTKSLLRWGIEQRKEIVVLRSLRRWGNLVPELFVHNIHVLNSVQNISFTPNNVPRYGELVKIIEDTQ